MKLRKAGEVWFDSARIEGLACCSKEPEKYPAQPKGGMSHGSKKTMLPMR